MTTDPKALIESARNPATHTCPDCGYVWKHGVHGGHSCVERLKSALADALAENARLEEICKSHSEAMSSAAHWMHKLGMQGEVRPGAVMRELADKLALAEANAAKLVEALRGAQQYYFWREGVAPVDTVPNAVNAVMNAALAANPGSALLEELRVLRAEVGRKQQIIEVQTGYVQRAETAEAALAAAQQDARRLDVIDQMFSWAIQLRPELGPCTKRAFNSIREAVDFTAERMSAGGPQA